MPFLAALHFLTTIPLTPRRIFTERELGRSLAFYPIVGVLIGIVLIAAQFGSALIVSANISAVLVLVVWVLITGALHLDGFMDACDGLFSHRATDERLRIMRDVHVGAWGVIGVVLLLIGKFALVQSADAVALLLAPTLARWALSVSVVAFPYGRAEGRGRTIKENASRKELIIATLSVLVVTLLAAPILGVVTWIAVLITTLLVARFALDRLPGLTGDVYGMITEVSEVVALLVLTR